MNTEINITGEQLANALHTLGVKFIMDGQSQKDHLGKQPARLILALAESEEARLRLSLIPLFLEHPEFARYVRTATKKVKPAFQVTFQCYYTAAVWLRQQYQPHQDPMPDLFSKELHLSISSDPEENLRALAKRHQELSGAFINWLGTYHHAAQRWLAQTRKTKNGK
ncbi:MAG: hypothetical protein IPP66_15210 [Anaerolineales bacterium]|nr:hypothetical protein [Anaerolineales bacterium]